MRQRCCAATSNLSERPPNQPIENMNEDQFTKIYSLIIAVGIGLVLAGSALRGHYNHSDDGYGAPDIQNYESVDSLDAFFSEDSARYYNEQMAADSAAAASARADSGATAPASGQ